MERCPYKDAEGRCIAPGETDGPACSFSGSDFERLCAVFPLHAARQRGKPLSATEATAVAYQRGLAQEADEEAGPAPEEEAPSGGYTVKQCARCGALYKARADQPDCPVCSGRTSARHTGSQPRQPAGQTQSTQPANPEHVAAVDELDASLRQWAAENVDPYCARLAQDPRQWVGSSQLPLSVKAEIRMGAGEVARAWRDKHPGPLDLRGASLSGRFLLEVFLDGCDARRADFSGCLLGGFLNGAQLSHASFASAVLIVTYFQGADLSRADFTGAFLHMVSLEGANLENARFGHATLNMPLVDGATDLTGADFTGATVRLPKERKDRQVARAFRAKLSLRQRWAIRFE